MAKSSSRNPFPGLHALLALTALGLGALPPAVAQQNGAGQQGSTSRIDDRRLGEEEQIRRRLEWFFGPRRAGTAPGDDLAVLRLRAVEETRAALARQRLARAAGTDEPNNFWVSRGPAPSTFGGWAFGTVSGRTPSIAADWAGGVLYAGTASGGLWKSVNDGLSWTQLFGTAGTMTVGTVAVDPNDPDVIWAGTGENVTGCEGYFGIGLLRSPDGGVTWETRNGSGGSTLENLASFANVIVDPRDSSHIVTGGRIRGCAAGSETAGALFTTTDGGLTWTKRIDGREIYEIAQDPTVMDVWWAATSEGVYKSVNNGVGWTLQTASGLPNGSPGRTEIAIAPSDSNVVYALFSGGPSFWRTTNGGSSWTQMASGSNACDGQCWYNMVLRVHNSDPAIVYRGTVHVFRSIDGGATWADLSNAWGASQKVHQDTHHLLMDPNDDDTFYVGSDGGVWKTQDGGATFLDRNGNLNTTQFYAVGVDATDPDVICGGAQDNSSLARTTSDVWALQAVTGDGFVCAIDPSDPSYAYITSYPSGGYPNVLRSTTGVFGGFGGITGPGSGITGGDRVNWVTPYILDPSSPNVLYLGTHRVYRSDNHGSSWVQVSPDDVTGGSGSLLSLEINRNFTGTIFSGSESGRVWRSTNGGGDWTDISAGLPARAINDIGGDPTNPDRAFAVVSGFNTEHVWEWNAGSGWTAHDGGLPNVPANTVLMLSDQDLLVGTDTGVFRSYDGGTTFTPYMDGLPEGTVVTDLKYIASQSLITAGTYGRGAWQVSIDPVAPILLYDSVQLPLTEIDGDGDGSVEPGETWSVSVVLRNGGGLTAEGVEARLATATAGVSVLAPSTVGFGDIPGGATAGSVSAYRFVVDPSFACDGTIVFDVRDITSVNGPGSYGDRDAAFTVRVVDSYEAPIPSTWLDDHFDPAPEVGWSHQKIDAGVSPCWNFPYYDEWQVASKDAGHGNSYHCGQGPGGTYRTRNDAWLRYGGTDSGDGPGIVIPADAIAATLTVVHWYDTVAGQDGGQVVVDGVEDNQDVYTSLDPVGGYPGGTITGQCSALQGQEAFQGSSGGWVTSTFDLLAFQGRTIYLAFVFASDNNTAAGEGWYVDGVTVETQRNGSPICQVVLWPGTVPPDAVFGPVAGGDIQATWGDACNLGELPGQGYSIQAGDLDVLAAQGSYTHAPLGGLCDRTSPATFTPGAGNEYYLIVPNQGGRDGGAGAGAQGGSRPGASTACGEQRVAACP